MFFHPHLMDSFFGNGHTLMDSMRLIAALAVEEELQESRRKAQLEKSCDSVAEHSKLKRLGSGR
jgi:hypothetical protein